MRLRRGASGFRSLLQGWTTPLVLLGVVVLSYGLWIPWMGLFGNDLPYLYYYHLLGPWGPGEFASIDRPVSAIFYAASTFLLGENIWPYHVFLLVLRWLSAVLFWWVLCIVWPGRGWQAAIAAVLLAVYPGFRQTPVAVEFILHFAVLDLFLLSLAATLLAAGNPRQYWGLAALSAASAAGLFWLEYFIGLEILRPVFLWIITRRMGLRGRQQWRRILVAWVPALLVVAVFLFWRVFVFAFPTYRPVLLDTLRVDPLAALQHLAATAARDLWTGLGGAWLQTLHLPDGRRSLLAFGLLAAAAVALVLWLRQSTKEAGAAEQPQDHWGETALGTGLLSMLAGGSIFWLTAIPVELTFPWDRSTLALMPGASLALAGLLDMLAAPRYRALIASALVALAVGMHFVNAQEYRAEWSKLQDFYWQLTWRAPRLASGALGLFDVIPLNRYSDTDLTDMLNWTYAPGLHDRRITYRFFDLTLRLDGGFTGLPGVEKGLPVQVSHRGLTFESNTSNTFALLYNPPACLKILGPEDALLPGLPYRIQRVLPMTGIDSIQPSGSPARPPTLLGAEPPHGWCYFFQKADLARQQGDWSTVAALGDAAFAANLHPGDPVELLPFIEGYARAGNIEQARVLSETLARQQNALPALCAVWTRAGSTQPGTSVDQIKVALGCGP